MPRELNCDGPDFTERYSSSYLVDLCAAGHFLINDEIDSCVRRILQRFGETGRGAMLQLPSLKAYPANEDVSAWLEALLKVERTLMCRHEAALRAEEERVQLEFPWS
jgi:hypothetical protein